MQATPRARPVYGRVSVVLAFLALAGCASLASSSGRSDDATADTVSGVGVIPDFDRSNDPQPTAVTEPDDTSASTDGSSVESATAPESSVVLDGQLIGKVTAGNRLLMIGDSITSSISSRYGDQACDLLVPLGWQVEVDAEKGRFVDFGNTVLDERLDAGWDAAVVFLGSNYAHDRDAYERALRRIIERLAPRPTVLINTTLFRPGQQDVNEVIAEVVGDFANTVLIDWESISEDASLLGADGYHLSQAGRERLGLEIATVMGEAPERPGRCMTSDFTNDTGNSGELPTDTTTRPTTKPRPPTSTTKPPSSTSAPSTSAPSTSTPSTSSPSTSAAPSTSAQTSSSTQGTTAPPSSSSPSTSQPAPTTSSDDPVNGAPPPPTVILTTTTLGL